MSETSIAAAQQQQQKTNSEQVAAQPRQHLTKWSKTVTLKSWQVEILSMHQRQREPFNAWLPIIHRLTSLLVLPFGGTSTAVRSALVCCSTRCCPGLAGPVLPAAGAALDDDGPPLSFSALIWIAARRVKYFCFKAGLSSMLGSISACSMSHPHGSARIFVSIRSTSARYLWDLPGRENVPSSPPSSPSARAWCGKWQKVHLMPAEHCCAAATFRHGRHCPELCNTDPSDVTSPVGPEGNTSLSCGSSNPLNRSCTARTNFR